MGGWGGGVMNGEREREEENRRDRLITGAQYASWEPEQ